MSGWGNNDNAANTPLWPAMQVKVAPTRANANVLFSNTVANTFITNETNGLFGIDSNEAQAAHHGLHTGWVLRNVGAGGRSGRVQEEVLVAMSSMNGDFENTIYPNTSVTIVTQPSNGSAIKGAGNTISFSVLAQATPNVPLTYYWQFNTGSSWANTSTQPTLFTGNTSSTLVANATTNTANSYLVRAIVVPPTAWSNVTVTSANAKITITP